MYTHNIAPAETLTDIEYNAFMHELDIVKYGMFQREVAPETGQEHLQGFVCLKQKRTLGSVIAMEMLGNNRTHWEVMEGTIQHNVAYCSKLSTRKPNHRPMETGVRPRQGKRNDIPDVIEFMVENPTMRWTDIALAEPRISNMMRYMSFTR